MTGITPGQNGYQEMLQGSQAQNPWTLSQGDSEQIQGGLMQGTQNLQSLMGQAQSYGQQSAPYPTFQNSMGLGTQSAFGAVPQPSLQVNAMNPGASSSVTSGGPTPDYSRGASPWLFQGDALSR